MPAGGGSNNINKKGKKGRNGAQASPTAQPFSVPFTLYRGSTPLTGPVPSPAEFTNRPKGR